ncbi:MAG: energy-coupling factor transporter ATPase [Clostridia bacterium]|nr:energy-coupling factor transporter ATPase [Clostridia bacterium]
MKAVELKNVSFKYGSGENLAVIKNLSLSVEKGEFLCVLGENGSGKSTLAKLINGLLLPDSGEVEVFGSNTKDKKSVYEVRKKVGMVFQNPDNQMVATIVEDDVAFGPENVGVSSEEIGERIDFALKAVGMEKFRFVAGQKLSGGQKQRVAIAGALALKPEVLILDESTAMLDPMGRKEVMQVAEKLNDEGMTLITITHYMKEAVKADRVVVLHEGEIVVSGTPEQVFSRPEDLKKYGLDVPRATYIAEKLKKSGVPIKSGILTEEELGEELCKLFQNR